MSIDLVIVDELFDVNPDSVEGGLLPAQRARKNPLACFFSTAGTEESVLFQRWREAGIRAIDKGEPSTMYMAEWSPDPSLDPLHPGSWAWGNPALGYTLDMDTIRQESTNPDRASFLRASLNLWVSVVRGWIEPGRWPSLEYTGDVPKRWGRGDRVFAGRLPIQRDQMRQPVRRSGARNRGVYRRVNYRAVGERAGTCQRPHDQVCPVANRGRNLPTKHRAPQGRGRLRGTRTVYTASQKHDCRSATTAHGRKTVGRTRPARRCRTHRQHHRAVKQTIAWAY
jgi:hypothetical protein